LNLVLSYGDLSRPGGYQSRVLGELRTLDAEDQLDPFLLVFDRKPAEFERAFQGAAPYRVLDRSAAWQFHTALAELAQLKPLRLVHAHNLYSAALALSLRWRFGYKVLLDYHGRIPEEYVFLGKGGPSSRHALELLERWCVTRADHVAAVSNKLADYLIGRYPVSPDTVSVIPCCADASIFKWSPERRAALRASMSLSNKFVCVHLGSFVEWYDPDSIADAFRQIQARTDSHLLVITHDTERAQAYLSAHFPSHAYTVRSATHAETPDLLNASDLGLLLLRSSPNIKTSSPVKFAEYLNSGLPVLISPEVGDFSELIAREQTGAVMDGRNFDARLVDRVRQQREQMASRCVEVGRRLTWQAFSPAWREIVRGLVLVPGSSPKL
jgi:glycosyltransferase involved in cell wall biosynthesis